MAISATTPVQGGSGVSGASDALRDVDLDQFLQLLITELQNQDPLDPTDNSEILQQLSQIREIAATGKLTDTLDSVLRSQQLSSASSLVGKEIRGLTDGANQQFVSGTVDRVTIADGIPKAHIGAHTIGLENISEILPGGN